MVYKYGDIQEELGLYDSDYYFQKFLMYWCGMFTETCQMGVAFIASNTFKPINFDRLRAFFGHYPAGSSIKCWKHWW